MDFFAGIDGGGTKTTLLCRDVSGNKIFSKVFDAFNFNSIGEAAFKNLLSDIADILNNLGHCLKLCIGAAGISNQRMVSLIDEIFEMKGIRAYEVLGDHEIALEGALGGRSGLAVIAGTGSICFGKKADGSIIRAGGWGHIIGDEGSAYALARDAFKAIASAYDGYGEKTVLADLLKERFSLNNRSEIIEYVYSSNKADIAKISIIVDTAVALNDRVAIKIIDNNANALARQICAVAKGFEDIILDVALLGGLLDKDTPLRKRLVDVLETLNSRLNCIAPENSAAEGAVMLARKRYVKEEE